MKNRIAIVATLAAMLGLFVLTLAPASSQLPQLAIAQSITGNSSLAPAPNAYCTICLPQNWKSDPRSQQLIADTAKPNLAHLRQLTTTKIYVQGDKDFQHRFADKVQTLPALLVENADGSTAKWSGDNCKLAESQCDGCIRKLLHIVKPEPTVKPEPEKPAKPDVPELPDTPTATPAATTDQAAGLILVGLLGMVGGLFAYFRAD